MKSLHGKIIVITGAASGIGRELALQLAPYGCTLAIADINEAELMTTASRAQTAGGKVYQHALDVSNRDAVNAFSNNIIAIHGTIDILINCAGILLFKTLENTSPEEMHRIVNVNMWGVIYCTKAFLPHLRKRPEACIVTMSSSIGLIGFPNLSAYSMTKFAVRGFTENLRMELSQSPITVICVHPGTVSTNIVSNSKSWWTVNEQDEDKRASLFNQSAVTSPQKAAKVIISAIKRKRQRVLIGRDAYLADTLQRLMPSSYHHLVINEVAKLKWAARAFK